MSILSEMRFVSDDIPIIDKNSNISNFSYIFSPTPLGSFERVLYYLAYKIGGANPILFRLPNLLFHFGCVFLVFLILSLISKKRLAIFAAFLFAVHPLLSESVTWISGGSYANYSFFLSLSLALISSQRSESTVLLDFSRSLCACPFHIRKGNRLVAAFRFL